MQNNHQLFLNICMWRQKALVVLVIILLLWRRNRDGRKRVKYAPLVPRDVWRQTELIRLIDTSDRTCISQLRMCRALFYKLSARLREKGLPQDTCHVSVEEQLAMFLKILGQNHTMAADFPCGGSGETVSRYFNQVLFAMGELARELIYVRSTDTHDKIASSPNKFYPYFEGCIGALDGTHIRYQWWIDLEVATVVDFDLRFTYVLAYSAILPCFTRCPFPNKWPENTTRYLTFLDEHVTSPY
ncbi:LOW QUALITY PROTEIN: hypothetical protein U9M48_018589 [Paspalum notatum var. saurae]|uniref:DUF8040 domain-containing protein n=1 Tax=Paspalum notatum var. saurae TaxID=547442 RepID=A0AAQ3WQF6_PASNO